MQRHRHFSESLSLKAAGSTYRTFAVMWGVLVLLGLFVSWKNPSASPIVGVGLPILVMIFCFIWIASFKLVIADGVISYRTLLSTRSLALSEIERADVRIGYDNYSDQWKLKPPIRLEIQPLPTSNGKPLNINLKVLRRADISRLIEVLDSLGVIRE